jgi:hypothetical protein
VGPAQNEDELGLNGSRGGGEDWKFKGIHVLKRWEEMEAGTLISSSLVSPAVVKNHDHIL